MFLSRSGMPLGGLLVVILVVGMAAGAVGLLIWAIRHRAKQADAAFVPLGLTARWYMRGRQYDGNIGGRPFHGYVLPPSRYRAASLRLSLGTSARGKMSLGPRTDMDFVRKLLGRGEVALGPDFARFVASADDPAALAHLASDPQTRGALLRLAGASGLVAYLVIEQGEARVDGRGDVYGTLLASPASLEAYLADLAFVASRVEVLGA